MNKIRIGAYLSAFFIIFTNNAYGLDAEILKLTKDGKERRIKIEYELKVNKPAVDKDHPIYVFASYRSGQSNSDWIRPLHSNIDMDGDGLRGEQHDGILFSAEKHTMYFYYEGEGLKDGVLLREEFILRIHAIEIVLVPKGSYIIGNDNATYEVDGSVNLNAFYAMKYPVTVKQYVQYLNETKNTDSRAKRCQKKYNRKMSDQLACGIMREKKAGRYYYTVSPGRENAPVVYVTWFNAYDYARWAGLRLLTEVEWEVLARGKGARRYSWGDSPEPSGVVCNMFNDGLDYASDVYKYEDIWNKLGLSSPFGAMELTGNVWEWVDTYWYDYSEGIYDETKSPTSYNNLANRLIRGGDWGVKEKWLRAAARDNDITSSSLNYGIGFRCGMDY